MLKILKLTQAECFITNFDHCLLPFVDDAASSPKVSHLNIHGKIQQCVQNLNKWKIAHDGYHILQNRSTFGNINRGIKLAM